MNSSLDNKFEELDFFHEQCWQNSLPQLWEKDWLKVFPEAREILPKKISEWEMKTDEIKDTYRTADSPAICSLSYFGFKIDSFERDPKSPDRITAFFERTSELDSTLQSLWNRHLTVVPIAFLEITRTIKSRLRDCY